MFQYERFLPVKLYANKTYFNNKIKSSVCVRAFISFICKDSGASGREARETYRSNKPDIAFDKRLPRNRMQIRTKTCGKIAIEHHRKAERYTMVRARDD